MKKIIGITGTLGAGKGTIVDFLVREKGFVHYSVRGYLTEELTKLNLEHTRENMVNLANKLRSEFGPSFIVEEIFKKASLENQDCIIESLRTLGEIEALKLKGEFILFAVDADPRIRYERVFKRKSSTDNISFDKFLEEEKKEMSSTDPAKQNLSKCISMADFKFENNGTVKELEEKVEKIIS